ncbi:hypothetical protein CMV_026441 [Castanea mollissima]|uniref:Uncharacterized protein n=1 Tax=Castanea mollissima TaxID=60419 RepID=A0A8J4QB43_9ROSI|nr:hypothetical protein CMV_026441 [Castanea mollissima]
MKYKEDVVDASRTLRSYEVGDDLDEGGLILLMVVAPSLFADTIRDNWVGVLLLMCLADAIVCYLLQEHIRAGGFINSFTRANGLSNTIGIVLLFVYPVWHWYLICYRLTLSSI